MTIDKPLKLKNLIQKDTIIAPGVFNPLSAKLAEQIGFRALYVSGAALHQSWGLPDTGGLYSSKKDEKYIFSPSKYLEMAIDIIKAADLPTIIDIDIGFGSLKNLQNAVKRLEEAGAAGVQIEDQLFPKKCGHLNKKEIVSEEEMGQRIVSAIETRKNKDFLIIARTDARETETLAQTSARAAYYRYAGADIIFPEALKSKNEFMEFKKILSLHHDISPPLLANMTEFGKTPIITAAEFKEMGYKIVIFPVSAMRVAMKAMEEFLLHLKETGTQKDFLDKMQTREKLYELIKYKP